MISMGYSKDVTRYGVAYNLAASPYRYTWGSRTFHFSTAAHRERFKERLTIRREWLNDSLSRRFKVKVSADDLAVLQLYMQTETRGFYVTTDEQVIDTPDKVAVTVEVR